ncbi:MAG: hypothetical protein J7604_26110 [Sporocytophaga sp.]|uniref:hypothetical protein n=1 Tax=Sporocytophaga sp. TaxID=2231183 RepID=UPI001B206668|nr:hypothetical protein [Sporocytophaga sp.]MBO9703707.1 hypothetical protein [Sporocytophaga sp.]
MDFTETGQIGDTIAGTTSPFIAILTIVLVYLTFTSQKEELEKTRELVEQQTNFMKEQTQGAELSQHVGAIEEMIKEILYFIDELEWNKIEGVRSLREFDPKRHDVVHTLTDELYAIILRFDALLRSANDISNENVQIVYLDRIFTLFYSKILWNVKGNIYDRHANLLMQRNDDCQLMIPKFAEISNKTLEYLIERNLVKKSSWKEGTMKSFKI